MPRRRAGSVSARPYDEGESGPKSGWKDKLTAQQLNRKRAADRQLVRENRSKARQTIASLQQQVELLSSQQPDQIVADVLLENKNLEAAKDSLRSKLMSVYSALGLSREDAHVLLEGRHQSSKGEQIASSVTNTTTSSIGDQQTINVESRPAVPAAVEDEVPQTEPTSGPDSATPFDLATELDFRMAVPNSPSPFPSICAALEQPSPTSNFSDTDFLEAIILWRSNTGYSDSVFNIASRLFHIDRPPSSVSSQRLGNLAHTPGILNLLIQDLEASEPTSAPVFDSMVLTNAPEHDDSLATTKRELAIAAYEAVRFWKYKSRLSRIVMFWALYRILTLLVFPTPQNLAKCPIWYRPLADQMWFPHPSFIDFFPWPQIRAHLMQNWQSYQTRNLFSSFVEHFDVQINECLENHKILAVDSSGCNIRLTSTAEPWFQDISCLRMGAEFALNFPELAGLVNTGSRGAKQQYLNSVERSEPGMGGVFQSLAPFLPISQSHTPAAFSITSSEEALLCGGGSGGADGDLDPTKSLNQGHVNGALPSENFSLEISSMSLSPTLGLASLLGHSGSSRCTTSNSTITVQDTSDLGRDARILRSSPLSRNAAFPCHKEALSDPNWNPLLSDLPNQSYTLDPSLSEWTKMFPWPAQVNDSNRAGASGLWFPV